MNIQTCDFSGRSILPGYGKRFVRIDKSQHIFLNAKCAASYEHKWNARQVCWTVFARRFRGKDIVIQQRKQTSKKNLAAKRAYGAASVSKLEELRKKYAQAKAADKQ